MEQRTRAREIWANPTEAEIRLWRAISARKVSGIRFNRQVPIGPFICDFVSRSASLIIEVDGGNMLQPQIRMRREPDISKRRDTVSSASGTMT